MIKNFLLGSALTFGVALQAQTVVFSEDFNEESTRSLWTLVDRDGDGDNWEFADAVAEEIETFDGWFALSWSWYFEAFTPDNLLISPTFELPESGLVNLSFKVATLDDDEIFQEHYAVYVIPAGEEFSGNEEAVFEETLDHHYYFDPKVVNVDISDFAGQEVQLVFRHYDVTDVLYISLDDISVTHEGTANTNDLNELKMSVFPNPTTDIVFINGLDKIENIRVFDMNGKRVIETENSNQVDLSALPNGNYIINVYQDSNVYSKRIMKK